MVNNTKSKKSSQQATTEPLVTDFGTRAISNQNFSKMIALPKTALSNCGFTETTRANVQLVQQKGEKFIKLTPVKEGKA